MSFKVADVVDEDARAWSHVLEIAMGETWGQTDHAVWGEYLHNQERLAAYEGETMVAVAGSFETELTIPGGQSVGATAVTGVGTLPTRTRQGAMTALMAEQRQRAKDAGNTVLVLESSEPQIYGRFGYGPATRHRIATLQADHAVWAAPEPAVGGSFDYAWEETIVQAAMPIWDAARRGEAGHLQRPISWWAMLLMDAPSWQAEGGGALRAVFHVDNAGTPDGYALFRVAPRTEGSVVANHLTVQEVVSAKPEVEDALIRWLCAQDLVGWIKFDGLRLDDPVQHRLADPRRLRVADERDGLWVRILDVPMALSSRRYDAEASATVRVHDPADEAIGGLFRIEVSPSSASCEPLTDADAHPDLEIGISALASAYLGGHRLRTLAQASRVLVHTETALDALDRAFGTPTPPRHRGEF